MVENSQVRIKEQNEPQADTKELSVAREDEHETSIKFFFLPPLVPYSKKFGVFNTSLRPVVEIADLSNGSVIAEYSMIYGLDKEKERIVLEEQYYNLNWYTDRFNFIQGSTYRINVSVGQAYIKLGHVDIKVVGTDKDLINVETNTFVPLLDDRVLPIKFRIEKGEIYE
jgi:hypothetical protein